MAHDELLAKLSNDENGYAGSTPLQRLSALRAVVELHKPLGDCDDECCGPIGCWGCTDSYPCRTIQAIEKELI